MPAFDARTDRIEHIATRLQPWFDQEMYEIYSVPPDAPPGHWAQQHMTRLADDAVQPDEIECMLFALHRAGHLDRRQLVHLQVKYLREAKP